VDTRYAGLSRVQARLAMREAARAQQRGGIPTFGNFSGTSAEDEAAAAAAAGAVSKNGRVIPGSMVNRGGSISGGANGRPAAAAPAKPAGPSLQSVLDKYSKAKDGGGQQGSRGGIQMSSTLMDFLGPKSNNESTDAWNRFKVQQSSTAQSRPRPRQ
jgi:hypothetical protein